jgi:hypothetical protein
MGIAIYACGKIDRIGDIPRLINELKMFAGESNRTYQIVNDTINTQRDPGLDYKDQIDPVSAMNGTAGLKGIIINLDPEAEPLSILFDQSGVLTDMTRHLSWVRSNGQGDRYTVCKSRFDGVNPRIRISELFANLKERYITDLIVNEEDSFWKTRDRRTRLEERIILGHCMCYAELVIGGIEISDDALRNSETIATRIEEALLKAENPLAGSESVGKGYQQSRKHDPVPASHTGDPDSL